MHVAQLRSILNEYPMSRKLIVVVEGQNLIQTTVADFLSRLMSAQPTDLLTFCGLAHCIVRERIDMPRFECSPMPMTKEWLELDMRQ